MTPPRTTAAASGVQQFEVSHEVMANAIRALAMDAVEQAKSGHPGMPMGMADVATVLVTRFLKFDPSEARWPDRDRLVLSAGHGSMLLYALLYLTGYEDMTIEEIERFRQLSSRTPGHPEHGHARGIETTSGPLGQGLANAVGMALAERLAAAHFGPELVDHDTYVIASDGDLMEGVSHEAISLAGHLGLSKLIVLYDDNRVSIDGPTELTVSDDQPARFRAAGWDVQAIDGHDPARIHEAIVRARTAAAPSLIACRTTIAYGAPTKAGTAAAHGAPLGPDDVAGARERLGWPYAPFVVPDEVLAAWRAVGARGADAYRGWRARLGKLDEATRAEFERVQEGRLPEGWQDKLNELKRALAAERPQMATRQASGVALEVLSEAIPELIGGSADLTGSNLTKTKHQAVITRDDFSGRYIHYGVREHAMAGVMSGLALHRGVIPYGGSFLIFTDYCRPAIRLAALMGLRVVYVMTHDSIGLGEDGPTHQPVEHLASLRAMPNLNLFRPADAVETVECWALALAESDRPSVLALTRQKVPAVRLEHSQENLCARGAYVLAPAEGAARVTLFASGSEVSVALEARAELQAEGIATRVVSIPCWELFEKQAKDYRAEILGEGTVRVAVEAAAALGWERFVGPEGAMIGMTSFGASAPGSDLFRHFGITAEAVVEAVKARL
ncbi:MAG: transketolase [Proteobacteria bacterium]|nr:transketolase [Pseudomonadota bacterium]